jgi:hypothetical protein
MDRSGRPVRHGRGVAVKHAGILNPIGFPIPIGQGVDLHNRQAGHGRLGDGAFGRSRRLRMDAFLGVFDIVNLRAAAANVIYRAL